MLLDGVTINDGKDSLAGVCATPICIDRRIAGIGGKAVEAIRPVAIMVDKRLQAERYRVGMKARMMAAATKHFAMSLSSTPGPAGTQISGS
jgi:hypothetical protein